MPEYQAEPRVKEDVGHLTRKIVFILKVAKLNYKMSDISRKCPTRRRLAYPSTFA
jgi:hypothetical protein